jgi:delta11-fatty-acid desaturase
MNGWDVPFRLLLYLGVMHLSAVLMHGYSLKGMVFMIVPEFIYTTCFTLCSQVNHLVPEASNQFNANFFIHQIITGHNVNTSGYWTTLFTGGLNMQVEHHLFPSVNHCHLHKLVPHVRALCVKHNIHYPESSSLYEGLSKHVSHLYAMGPVAFKNEWTKKHK